MTKQDLEEAKRNREVVEKDIGGRFYAGQARILAQWELGEKPPKELILGELPQVNKIRLRREDD